MTELLDAAPLLAPTAAQFGALLTPQAVAPAAAPVAVTAAAAPAAPAAPVVAAAPKIVDLDAGNGWGSNEYTFKHPFRFRGVDYLHCSIREPNGGDVERRIKGNEYMKEVRELAVDLTMLPDEIFAVMHAADRAGILSKVGNAIAGVP